MPRSAQADVDVSLEEAWVLWEDRERIPAWMPWISSVKVRACKGTAWVCSEGAAARH